MIGDIDQESIHKLLTDWNNLRLDRENVKAEIAALETRVECLGDRMRSVHRSIESDLFFIEQPYGLKIGEDYIIVIRDSDQDVFTIQTVDFNLREEIANDT